MARQNRGAARRSFEQALALDPDLFEALRGRIFSDLVDGKPDQAKLLAERQLEKSPNDPRLLLLAAGVYSAMKDTARQEATLNRLVEVDPDNLQGFAALAALYVRQGRLDQAREKYESLSTRGSNTVAAKTMVGLIYEAQNRPAEAKAAYEKLLATDPEAAVAANNLAWRYAEDGGNLDVALSLAQTAKRKLPDSPEVSDTLGWIYFKKDLPSLAVGPLQDSLRRRPDAPVVLYHLGMTYAKLGDKAKARETLEKALKLDPTLYEAAYYYGRTLQAEGKHERSVAMYERAVALRPDDYQALSFVTMAYQAIGDEKRMLEAIEQLNVSSAFKNAKPKPADLFDAQYLPPAGERKL